MQVNQPQGSNAEATTPRYDTIVIRGALEAEVSLHEDAAKWRAFCADMEVANV